MTVNEVEVDACQERVVLAETPGQRLDELRDFRAHPPLGKIGEDGRVAFTGGERFEHRLPRHARYIGGHGGQFDAGVF